MKKALLLLFFITLFATAYAQWTPSGNNIYNSNPGNVGIGTTSPQQLLNINSSAIPSVSQFKITANGLGSVSALNYASDNVSIGFDVDYSSGWIARNASVAWLYKTGGQFLINGSAGNTVGGVAVANTLFDVNLSSGMVGIGTSTPINKLDVEGGDASIANAGGQTSLVVGSSLSGSTYMQFYTSAASNGYGIIQTITSSGCCYGNTVINPIYGNVLIGKTSQANTTYMLDVAGSVRSNAVVVNSSGSDFVFEPKYKLPKLSFLEKYINQNHHLPEIPSAKEMQTNGLDVGKNETKLLQKVEELTLYLIEKDKEIKKQQEELDLIKKQLQSLTVNKSKKVKHL